MCEILNFVENTKKRYSEILKEELQNFDENAENRVEELRKKVLESRKDISCGRCGACCRLAICPYSPDELKEKALNGDKTAEEFINTFSEYENLEDAKRMYPAYFEAINKTHEVVYFYHCKLVTDDNLCPKYENRPQICRKFPDNPLEIFPETCEYKRWQNLVKDDMLRVKAIVDILDLEKENFNG